MRTTRHCLRWFLLLFLLPLGLHAAWWQSRSHAADWRSASWSGTGLLPVPQAKREATIHVLAAPTGRWKGIFSLHSWIVVKERGAASYTRFDVAGWGRPVKVNNWAPDGLWYGNRPQVLATLEGPQAEKLIPRVRAAVARYPYSGAGDYRIWPGPNSNTFVAAVVAEVPELGLAMPSNALGKDFRADGFYAGLSPSRTGVQLSLWGAFGLTVGWVEGLELNVLGLVTGLDIRRPAVKLPGWGRIGLAA